MGRHCPHDEHRRASVPEGPCIERWYGARPLTFYQPLHLSLIVMKLLTIRNIIVAATMSFGTAAQTATLSQPSSIQAQQGVLGAFQLRVLALHNDHRKAVGAPPLRWDDGLEAGARDYAAILGVRQDFDHSPRQTRPGQSENLWRGTSGAYPVETMIGYWAEERSAFVPGIYPNISSTHNWLDVSHYTTMIWPDTTHVGCHVQRSLPKDYLVCRYSPTGNRDGRQLP